MVLGARVVLRGVEIPLDGAVEAERRGADHEPAVLEGAQERFRHPGPVQPGSRLVAGLAFERRDASHAELRHEERTSLLRRDRAEDRPHLGAQSAVDLAGVPEVPVDVHGPRIEEVAHVVREVLEPLGLRLAERAGRAEEVAPHEVDVAADAPRTKLGVQQPVHLLVLGKRDARRVRLVEERHPELGDAQRLDPLGEHVGEPRHVGERERDAAALPRDVDPGSRSLRERHGALERVHPVGERPLGRVEEDPDERGSEPHDLVLERSQPGGRPAEVRVDVLVELDAEAVESADPLRRCEHELGTRSGAVRRLLTTLERQCRERSEDAHRNKPDCPTNSAHGVPFSRAAQAQRCHRSNSTHRGVPLGGLRRTTDRAIRRRASRSDSRPAPRRSRVARRA